MTPYTPRPRAGGRKKNLGLSAKEYTKVTTIQTYYIKIQTFFTPQITGTIASVRRHRHPPDEVDDINIGEHGSRGDRSKSTRFAFTKQKFDKFVG
jgi:gamma-tubulin complex component 2